MEKSRRLLLRSIMAIMLVVGIGSLLLSQTAPNNKAPNNKAPNNKDVLVQPSPGNAAASPVASDTTLRPGRYQIVFNPNVRADTFLLDTQVGKVWQLTG